MIPGIASSNLFVKEQGSRQITIHLSFFYKQPVYKQPALGWENCYATFRAQASFTNQQQKLQSKEKRSFSFVINVK